MGLVSDAEGCSISAWVNKQNKGSKKPGKRDLRRLPDGRVIEVMADGSYKLVEG